MNEKLQAIFQEFYDSILALLPNLLTAIVVFILFFLAGKLFDRIFEKRIQTKWKDNIVSRLLGETVKWAFYLFGMIAALHVLGFGGIAGSVLAGAGVSAIIIGFAFKDIAENFLAGVLLAINRPFRLNDIIEIENYKGTVKSLDLRTTHIRMIDGRDTYIPNALIVKNILTNYTKDGLIRLDFILGIKLEDDYNKARTLVLEKLLSMNELGVLEKPAPMTSIDQVGVNSIDIKVYFWMNAFHDKKYQPVLKGELLKSRVIREITTYLIELGYSFPANVLEHKMFEAGAPMEVSIAEKTT